MPEASAASSSYASIMQSDENVRECEEGRCKVGFRDLEAGLPVDSASSVDEEEMHAVDLCEDRKAAGHLEAINEAEVADRHDASCDVRALVDSELREPLVARVQTDDSKCSQDKKVFLSCENKPGGDVLKKEAGEVHGLRKRRGTKVESLKSSIAGDSSAGKMPEEERKALSDARTKDASTEPKPVEKKAGKQGKGTVKPSAVRRVGDPQPLEELRAKEEAETNRKVHESLDNFIRQTIRCETYMNLPRLRPEIFENPVEGKYARGFKVDGGSDVRDFGTEENIGVPSLANDIDGLKDGCNSSTKGIAGLGRGPQHSLKVPPGVVAFTQAAAKGTDLQGWLSPSKIAMTKCEKCSREFCSSLNYRRHVRVHRRSLNPEKEDLSKERSKVAAFWDKLSPEEASSIVHYDQMEIEDLSGQSALKALNVFIQQPTLPSLPQGILKAGAHLLDIVKNRASVFPLSSERLLNILDEASERTFLCGGTSVAVQRFVFNGDAGKVGLEEKNLVATMGFHIELKLVKAWMADKEAEALRCQQALFKEEEAAQEKLAKLLEKKRMKKIRQKERKGSASQQVLQGSENESVDDGGTTQGGEEDDSPTATGSCSSSLASAQDLALQESADMDMTEDLSLDQDVRDENILAFEDEQVLEKSEAVANDEFHSSHDVLSSHEPGRSRIRSHLHANDAVERRGDIPAKECSADEGRASYLPGVAVEVDGHGDGGIAPPVIRNERTVEVRSGFLFRKEERDGSDYRRRELDRPAPERKALRISRDRTRNDYSESVQKHGRDSRVFEGRYGDGPQAYFKPPRKANAYFVKGDTAGADVSNVSRVQQYRSKLPGMSRPTSAAGNGQVVWTRKVPQSVAVDTVKDGKEAETRDEPASSKVESSAGWEDSEGSSEVTTMTLSSVGDAAKLDKKVLEKKEEDAVSSVFVDDRRPGGSSGDVISAGESAGTDESHLSICALLVGSLSVPLGKFAMVSPVQTKLESSGHSGQENDLRNYEQRQGMANLAHSTEEVVCPMGEQLYTGDTEGFDALGGKPLHPPGASGSMTQPPAIQAVKSKPPLSMTSPERGDSNRPTIAPLGHDRLAMKQGSWQTSAGRYVSAKVWRAVGMVGERHDSTSGAFNVAGGDNSSSFCDGRLSQEALSGRSETETSPKVDVGERGPNQRDQFRRDDHFLEGNDRNDAQLVVNTCGVGKHNDYDHPSLHASVSPTRLVGSGAHPLSEGKVDYLSRPSDDGYEPMVLASGLCSLSVFMELAGAFFNERWRAALAQASIDEILVIPAEVVSGGGDEINFLDILAQQLSDGSTRHYSGAESLFSQSSSVVTESLGKPAKDPGMFLSRIFSDFGGTGVEDVPCNSTTDDQRYDRDFPEECGFHQALSSEDDAGMREASSSPVDSENSMSGGETSKNSAGSSASVGRVGEKRSKVKGGSRGVGSSHGKLGNGRLDRWYQNPQNRFTEQRYMPRRRAPVEKNF